MCASHTTAVLFGEWSEKAVAAIWVSGLSVETNHKQTETYLCLTVSSPFLLSFTDKQKWFLKGALLEQRKAKLAKKAKKPKLSINNWNTEPTKVVVMSTNAEEATSH